MKKILIVTNYYPPEKGAASNRIFHLAEGLSHHNFEVSVVSPLPNYPKGEIFKEYKGYFKKISNENKITVHRLWIFASNSKNKLLRLLAMLSYSFSLFWFFAWNKIPRTVIVQSPPLLVAFTSILFLKLKSRKIILNVSDLWPMAGLELGAFQKESISFKMLCWIERFNYRNSNLILGQSEEILSHVCSLFPKKQTFLYRNFPNFVPPSVIEKNPNSEKLQIVYAGLLGVAQGIYKLCKELDYSRIQLHLYGAGAEQSVIENQIVNNPKYDVIYHGEVSRARLHEEIIKYDITIIPLVRRIYGSVPSKIFEYARLGIPILYFGGGEGEHIIEEHGLGWIARSGDYSDLNLTISKITLDKIDFNNRNKIQNIALEHFDYIEQLKNLIALLQ